MNNCNYTDFILFRWLHGNYFNVLSVKKPYMFCFNVFIKSQFIEKLHGV